MDGEEFVFFGFGYVGSLLACDFWCILSAIWFQRNQVVFKNAIFDVPGLLKWAFHHAWEVSQASDLHDAMGLRQGRYCACSISWTYPRDGVDEM